jgi:hypothetical protein
MADAETARVVAKEELKELEELRKLRRVWGERSKVPLKEQVAGGVSRRRWLW